MITTLIALLFAHIMADFLLQTRYMITHKRNFAILLLHILIVAALSYGALGFTGHWLVLAVAGSHLMIDAAKTYWPGVSLRAFLIDQTLHILIILAAVSQFPDLYSTGIWREYGLLETPAVWLTYVPDGWITALPQFMLLSGGLIMATRAGGFAIGLFMQPLTPKTNDGMPQAGAIIGNLERALAYVFILSGQPQNLGFLIAAKSILRFGATQNDRKTSEYVIIGTLCSFGWVIAVALITAKLWEYIS